VAAEEEEELLLADPEPECEAEPAPAPEPPGAAAPVIRPAWIDPPSPRREVAESAGAESLTALLARFERALEKRASQSSASMPAASIAPDEQEPETMDVRLRSALENLKRFAPRHG
jgi:hypothetical protein